MSNIGIERCQCSDTSCACKGECVDMALPCVNSDKEPDTFNACERCGEHSIKARVAADANRRGQGYQRGYAWLITIDRLLLAEAPPKQSRSRVGTIGPSGCALTEDDIKFLPHTKFRLFDDDGELYYEGLFVGDITSELAFGPLDDFGEPDAGCTRIDYEYPDGKWRPM